jgi:NitT/TauT family transport system ATP-binding protein
MKLEIRDVSKVFRTRSGTLQALDGINLAVEQGEFVCLLGPSGCGKSTLLNIIAGLVAPSRGQVQVDGRPVVGPGTDRVVIFQDAALFPWLNVRANVEFGLQMAEVSAARRRELSDSFLHMVHLHSFADAYVHELSGGMKQRVALARALVLDPAVLLMDEPFGALDAQTRDILHLELQHIWARTRKTIVFVTHNVREAICLGDRVIVLTAQPAQVKAEFKIDLPRPRQIEDHALVDLVPPVLDELRGEVRKVVQTEVDRDWSLV